MTETIYTLKITSRDGLNGYYNYWIHGEDGHRNFIKVLTKAYHDLSRPYVMIHRGLLTQTAKFTMARKFNYYEI